MSIQQYTPTIIRAISRFRREKKIIESLHNLDIEETGLDASGTPFIKQRNDWKFHGHLPDPVQLAMYKYFLPKSLKQKISPECINVAMDVVKRHLEDKATDNQFWDQRFKNLKAGATVIEGGAFIGLYAMHLSRIVGETGKVIAVEAIKENFDILKKNIEVNAITNIIPVNRAIWSGPESLTFYHVQKQLASFSKDVVRTENSFQVPADSLDNIVFKAGIHNIDYVRLQINGAELEAMPGMEKILLMQPEIMITSLYKVDGEFITEPVMKFLSQRGYQVKFNGGSIYASYRKA